MTRAPLRVGFDYWLAATHAPGVGRYLRELVRALALLETGPELALLDVGPAGEAVPPGEAVPEEALGLARATRPLLRRRARIRRGWLAASERLLGARAETWLGRLDVFHRARAAGAPRSRAPQVVALAEPPAPEELAALRELAAVLVFTEHARRALVERSGLDARRVHCVPVGADHWLRDLPARTREKTRPRILVLGAVRRGRGHAAIVAAFGELRGRGLDVDLAICGRRGDEAGRLESLLRSSPFRSDARWIDEPSEAALPELAASADVLVHLEREAWTAVTPLEALSFGAAVVASRLPAFVEVLGDAARYVDGDPDAPEGLAGALEEALRDAALAAGRERRRAFARAFTWAANARATLAVYGAVARRGVQ